MALLLACSSHYSFADNVFTRGIGRYPGRVSQFTAPRMVKDYDYRNIALNRMVFTSSNADFNLTGQLITDGLVTKNEPAFLSVRTNEGEWQRPRETNRRKHSFFAGVERRKCIYRIQLEWYGCVSRHFAFCWRDGLSRN